MTRIIEKFEVSNNNEHFGDADPQLFDTLEEAESYREELIEEIIELHREEELRTFWESDEGKEVLEETEESVINDGLRQEAKEAINITIINVKNQKNKVIK
jgi:hypothetical protein